MSKALELLREVETDSRCIVLQIRLDTQIIAILVHCLRSISAYRQVCMGCRIMHHLPNCNMLMVLLNRCFSVVLEEQRYAPSI